MASKYQISTTQNSLKPAKKNIFGPSEFSRQQEAYLPKFHFNFTEINSNASSPYRGF